MFHCGGILVSMTVLLIVIGRAMAGGAWRGYAYKSTVFSCNRTIKGREKCARTCTMGAPMAVCGALARAAPWTVAFRPGEGVFCLLGAIIIRLFVAQFVFFRLICIMAVGSAVARGGSCFTKSKQPTRKISIFTCSFTQKMLLLPSVITKCKL